MQPELYLSRSLLSEQDVVGTRGVDPLYIRDLTSKIYGGTLEHVVARMQPSLCVVQDILFSFSCSRLFPLLDFVTGLHKSDVYGTIAFRNL